LQVSSMCVGAGSGLYMYGVIVNTFTFAISSTDEFLFRIRYWL